MALRFLMLGPPEIRTAAGQLPVSDPRQSTLFTALAVNANAPMSLDRLASALWAGPLPSVRWQVRTTVSALRQTLTAAGFGSDNPRLLWRRDGYLLTVERDELDLDRFTLLFRQGRAALDADDHRAAAYLLGEALAVWRGPAGLGCETFGWLRRRLSELNDLRWSAVEGRLVALLALGRTIQAVAEARAMLSLDPLHVPWWACLIAGLRDSGETAAAQKAHDEARRIFIDKFGLLPDDVHRLLYTALLPSRLRGENWIRQTPPPRSLRAERVDQLAGTECRKIDDCAARW